ncbi:DUF302 domain-containing protein [Terriglobus sp. TAA 43]|uniref:DUF302 domain-containing protein n=1 Tax=Terriglobus sp. TAA 43 TaxID=278961 RepID=UPI000645E1F2|nr:DUF302 domain-containing protein [Terriglobus sp. TAA 43]
MSIRKIKVQRITVISHDTFDSVVARLDAQLGHPDMAAFRKKLSEAHDESEMKAIVDPAAQPNGIMEFARFDLGDIIRKENGTDTPRVLRIVAGNPLIMKEMVKHVPDAGSYAPVTILIDERADGIHISYDTMVSHLAPYGNSEALQVAKDLDIKIETIMDAAK